MDTLSNHLENYLHYYMNLDKPGYAVLVTGAWGTGKTHQVKNAIPEDQRYYISLFGLTDIDQVSKAVFAEVNPTLSKINTTFEVVEDASKSTSNLASFSLTGAALGAAGALIGSLGASGIKYFSKNLLSTGRAIIFDDLERSGLSTDQRLGIINLFVEQLGCKVIVIANDKEIAERFDEKKEKLIGQTIRIEPRTNDAFEAFSKTLKPCQGEFVQRYKSEIIDTFKTSARESLRILKYVVDDVSRFHNCLSAEYLDNKQAMAELVRLFTALDIETRYGSLTEPDLRGRQQSYIISAMNGEKGSQSPIKILSDRYSPLDLTNTLIDDDLAVSLFIKGSYQRDEIERSLNVSPYFSDPATLPPWLGLYQFYRIPADEAQSYLDRLNSQIANFEITCPGELLHSFALLLLLSHYGLIEQTKSELIERARNYLATLLDENRLAENAVEPLQIDDLTSGHRGFGFWFDKSYLSELNEIRAELIAFQQASLEKQLPTFAEELIQLVKTDAQEFYNDVCPNSARAARFLALPVLACIEPNDFLAALLSVSPAERRIVSSALKDRYDGSRIDHELTKEKPWIIELLRLVDAKSAELTGFASLQLKLLFGQHFRDRVTEFTSHS
jgi:hypothetical protein